MASIFDQFKSFLQDHFQAEFEPIEADTIAFRMEDDAGHEWGCLAVGDDENAQLMFYSVLLDAAPDERRDELMRFVTLANYGMQVGNFEFDLADGELRFKTAIDVEGLDSIEPVLGNLIEINLGTMSRYFEALMSVVSGERSAIDAISSAEQD